MPYHNMETGKIAIGYTGDRFCENCQNVTPLIVYEEYLKQSIYVLIPVRIPVSKQWCGLSQTCPICEKVIEKCGTKLLRKKTSTLNFIEALNSGKELNKKYVLGLNEKDRKLILKRLNSLGAYELVSYIGGVQ